MNRLFAAALAFALLAAPVFSDPALAERRVALLVGNSAYQNATALANPSNDSEAVAGKLKDAGFDVISAYRDLGNLRFKRVIRQFEDAASDADIVVVFYAGHGIEIRGVNYLIPVDATLASDRDADDEAITLDRLLQSVEGAKRLGVVILDACRDNPFARTMKRARTAALRAGVTPGLAIVEPASRNTLIAYAAKSGTPAEDGVGQHSPFTNALLNNLFVPGLDVRLAFGRVRDEVLKSTKNRQEPFVSGSLGGTHLSLVPAPVQPAVATVAAAPDESGQKNDYALVERIGTKRAWEVFLNQHPSGFYAELARQHISKLIEPGAPPAAGRKVDEPVVASLTPSRPPSPPGPSSEEQRAWDRIKDSSNAAAFRDFIRRYPSSVLSNTAQTRLEALERAAQEREEKARAEREAKAAEAERQRVEREAALKRAEEERQAKLGMAARATQERQEGACRRETDLLATLKAAAGSQAWAREDLKRLEQNLTCERLRPQVVAALGKGAADPDRKTPAAVEPSKPAAHTPDLVRSAQKELARIGCFTGTVDGNFNPATQAAIKQYQTQRGRQASAAEVTDDFIAELKDRRTRVCPLVCPTGKVAEGDTCVAARKSAPVARQRDKADDDDDEDDRPRRRQKARQQEVKPQPAASRPQPRVRQEAARPAPAPAPRYSGGGGGGGGGRPMIGVGF